MRGYIRQVAFLGALGAVVLSMAGCSIYQRMAAHYKPRQHIIVVNSEPEAPPAPKVDVAANIGLEGDDDRPVTVLSDAAQAWPPPRNVIPPPPSKVVAQDERIPLRVERLFTSSSRKPQLSNAGKQELDRLATQLARYNSGQLVNIAIVDYTATKKEVGLAQRRADTVKEYLAKKGVHPALLKSSAQRPIKVAANCKGKKKAKRPECAVRSARMEVVVRKRT